MGAREWGRKTEGVGKWEPGSGRVGAREWERKAEGVGKWELGSGRVRAREWERKAWRQGKEDLWIGKILLVSESELHEDLHSSKGGRARRSGKAQRSTDIQLITTNT